ncbi:hypothetical protein JAO71_07680 [Olleya sp. YSTF-M6]|uniref:Uncharacterized protein n=1 Tax=Olleya sediminilitoris TaxID=2795739 RepID=A0ABS1WKM7_9FLAO|nr:MULTISPECIES: hypothetical protein [Olleya]MBL7559681.1 hypothetical protein [Olleya sediminilitoris]
MLKNILATIVGFIVAAVTVYIFETLLGHNLYPLPETIDPNNMESIKANMHLIPIGAKVFVVIAHFLGIITGMTIAGIISKTSIIPSYIVGGLMVIATITTIVMLPKELWFSLSDGILAISAFFFGKSLASRFIYGSLV